MSRKYIATISGMEMEFTQRWITGFELMSKIHPLLNWGNSEFYHEEKGYFYIPQHNGLPRYHFDGSHIIDLTKYKDFIMSPVRMDLQYKLGSPHFEPGQPMREDKFRSDHWGRYKYIDNQWVRLDSMPVSRNDMGEAQRFA